MYGNAIPPQALRQSYALLSPTVPLRRLHLRHVLRTLLRRPAPRPSPTAKPLSATTTAAPTTALRPFPAPQAPTALLPLNLRLPARTTQHRRHRRASWAHATPSRATSALTALRLRFVLEMHIALQSQLVGCPARQTRLHWTLARLMYQAAMPLLAMLDLLGPLRRSALVTHIVPPNLQRQLLVPPTRRLQQARRTLQRARPSLATTASQVLPSLSSVCMDDARSLRLHRSSYISR